MRPSFDDPEQQAAKAQRVRHLARENAISLYPDVSWIQIDQSIYLASLRTPKSEDQIKILEKELTQARILAALGHTVYLLPESGPRKTKHPDAIVDGFIMEFKTITGNERKIRENFKDARRKAENVFLKIDADFSQEVVLEKLIGTVRRGNYSDGMVIVHFTKTGKTYYWTISGMK
jgi:hypothetical protein